MVVTTPHVKKVELLVIIGLALLLLVSYFSFDFRFFLKRFTDPVALGYSNVKLYTLLGYALVFFICKFFSIRAPFTISRLWIGGLAVGLFLYGLCLHLLYVASYQLPFWAKTTAVYEQYFSGNHITHIHVLKPVLVVLGSLFGAAKPTAFYENGYAFFWLLPQWLYYLGAVLVVLLAFSLLFYWLQEAERLPNRLYWVLTGLYLLSSYSVFKNILDGGIFDLENFLALPIFLAILIASRWQYQHIRQPIIIAPFLFVALVPVIYSIDRYFRPDDNYNSLAAVLAAFAATSVLYGSVLSIYFFSRRHFLFGGGAMIIIAAIFLLLPNSFTTRRLEKLGLHIPAGGRVVISSFESIDDQPLLYQVGSLRYYALTVQKAVIARSLYEHYNLSPDYSPIDVDGFGCSLNGQFNRRIKIRPLEARESPANISGENIGPFVKIVASPATGGVAGHSDYFVDFVIRGCTPRFINANYLFLQERGLKKYIVVEELLSAGGN